MLRSYRARDFPAEAVAASKRGRRISVCLPARDEEATIGTVCALIRTELMEAHGVVDELVGSYVDREDPALSVRFPLLDRPGEALVIWTTTPWTLPANVAAAVRPDADYGRKENGDWIAVQRAPEGEAGWRDGPIDEAPR